MPSPLGHALAGAAVGWLAMGSSRKQAAHVLWTAGAGFAVLGMMPDLDLLTPLTHRGPTHSLGAALVIGLAAAALTRTPRAGLAAACAYATHVALDWMSADTSAPRGVMSFWPLSREFHYAGLDVFDSIWRRNETPDFWPHNIRAVARELAILVPPAALVFYFRRSSPAAAGQGNPNDGGRAGR